MRIKPTFSFIGQTCALMAMCVLPCSDALARHLQPDEALSMLASGPMKSASRAPLRLAYTQNSQGESTVYVFDREGAPGFYVLAADDAIGDIVLGYSHTGRFSAENMAPGMKWLLNTYSEQVNRCASAAVPAARKAAPQGLQAVAPLLTTLWNQYEPYNDMCPMIDGERAITGCVATAMAQVMKKHRWPASGTGSYSYTVDGVHVSSDFSSHVYAWDDMLDDYYEDYQLVGTPAQKEAVAQLMFDCGVAAQMGYSPWGSSATSMNAALGMLNYFNYDKSMEYVMRDWYSDDDWMRLMHAQISQGLPVIYGGDSVEGYGHEFVLDGYDGEGYFHFNWGWGGYDDGYFSLDYNAAEGEDIGYVCNQEALVNVRPDMGSSYAPVMGIDGVLYTKSTEYAAKYEYIAFAAEGGGFWSYALSTVDYELGVKNTLDGNVVTMGNYSLAPYYGFYDLGAPSQDFPVGEYDVYLVYKTADTDWAPMRYFVNLTSGRLHFINDGTTIKVGEAAADIPATAITLTTNEQKLTVGDTFTLVATVSPENATDKTVTWSTSDAAVATVDADGKVTAVAPGTATITATCGEVSATCTVTVAKRIIAAESIALNTEAVALTEGDSYQLTAVVSPENVTDETVTWSTSDAAVATVDADGKVTAVAPGVATITATCGEVSATCTVTVAKRIIAAEGIALNTEAVELTEGDSYQLTAVVSPENTTDKTITWATSDAAVATVDADGKVTAVAPGTATITATCGEVSATCTVTVVKRIIAAEGIALNTEAVELTEGDSYQLTAVVSPENTTDKTVTWATSDAAVATVDADGKVTAVAPGTATITATCGEVSAGCTVTVVKRIIAAEGIALNTEAVELTEGDSYQLTAVVSPENTTDKTITWATSDAAVATVDADGKVTAVGEGSATITATCGEVSATCTVTVVKRIIAAESVTLSTEALDLVVGDDYQLIAVVSPDNTTDQTLTWSTSDAAVATVDAEGKVTAVGEGSATITATCGEASATCVVTVKKIDGIWTISADGISIRVFDGSIHVEAPEDVQIAVYDLAGTLYYIGYDHTIPVSANKFYIVVVGSKTFKVKA